MSRARAWSRALVATWILAAPRAEAESPIGPNVRVSVASDPGCPSEPDFVAAIEGAVAPGALASAPPTQFRIALHAEQQGIRGELLVARGEEAHPSARTVFSSSCREAAEALALDVVLIVDPLASQPRFPTASRSPTPEMPPPSTIALPAEAPAAGPTSSRPAALSLAVGASSGAATGVLPGLSFAADARAAVSFTRAPLELVASAGVLAPVWKDVAGGAIRFWAPEAGLEACGVLRRSPLAFGLCAGGRADWVITNAQGFVSTTTTVAVVPSAIVAPYLRYVFGTDGRFMITLEPELGVVLSRTTWNVIPLGDVHQTSLMTGRLALAFTLGF